MTKPSQEHLFQVAAQERFDRELAEANGELINWVEEEEVTQVVDTKEAVYVAMVEAQEGGGYVYLDNINLANLGITEHQFAGYCSALTKEGRYNTTPDKAFGIVVMPSED